MAAIKGPRLYKKQIGTHREKKHVLTLTLMLVRRKSACETSAGSSKIFRWLAPLLGPNLDPKTGPKQRPKRRNENVTQFWTPFWGPYLDPKMGSAIGEFRCCPQMFCKQICDPAAWTWMSTHTFSLCASQGRLLLYKKQIGTHREKKHVLTLTLMLVRRKSACETPAGSSKIFRWLAPLLGPNLDPKTGPKQRPKRRNENVTQFWTPFWGPYLDPKMGSAIGEFRCCPQMFCKQICDPAAWTWMSTHTFSLCASQGRLLLSRSLYGSHVLSTFFGPVLGAMMQQVCWHSRRSEAHRGLPEARPRTQNVMARGQSEAHGDSNLYNTRQDWMSWNQKTLAMITSQDIHCFHESLHSKMRTHAPCGTLTSKHMQIFVPRYVPSLLRNKEHTMWPPWPHLHVILHFFSR